MNLLAIHFYEEFATFKENTLFPFSKKYYITFKKEDFSFHLIKNNLYVDDFYSSNIDISILIGENGLGKSLILNILKDNDFTKAVVLYEEKENFYILGPQKDYKVFIKQKKQKIYNKNIDHYIYYSPIIESTHTLSNKKIKLHDISNKQLLSNYDNYPLNESLLLIENDDLKNYFSINENPHIKKYVTVEKIQLMASDSYFRDIEKILISNYTSLFQIIYRNIQDTPSKKKLLLSILHLIDRKVKVKVVNHILNRNNDSLLSLLLEEKETTDKLYSNLENTVKKNKYYTSLVPIIEEYHNYLEYTLPDYKSCFADIKSKLTNESYKDLIKDEFNFTDIIEKANIQKTIFDFINENLEDREFSEFKKIRDDLGDSILFEIAIFTILNYILSFIERRINYAPLSFSLRLKIIKLFSKYKSFSKIKYTDSDYSNLLAKLIGKDPIHLDYLEKQLPEDRKRIIIMKYISSNPDDKLKYTKKEEFLITYLFILRFEDIYNEIKDEENKLNFISTLFQLQEENNLPLDTYHLDIDSDIFNIIKSLKTHFNLKENIFKKEVKITKSFIENYRRMIINGPKPVTYKLSPTLSSGQKAILFLYSRIQNILAKIEDNATILILLDEVDLKLHLEWQRKFLKTTIDFLKQHIKKKFYILYATHSPLILSDITNDRVLFLEKTNKYVNEKVSSSINTFGANIYDIYHDSFFMTSFMGEFAETKINTIINILNLYKIIDDIILKPDKEQSLALESYFLNYDIEDIQKSYHSFFNTTININIDNIQEIRNSILEEKISLKNIILKIGEPILKNKLLEDFEMISINNEEVAKLEKMSSDELNIELENYNQEEKNKIIEMLIKKSRN